MIKVLFVISNLYPQGPINQLFYLCKYLNRKFVEPYVVTTTQCSVEQSMHKKFRAIGVKVIDLKLGKILSVFYAKKQIQNIIDEHTIDIIQSFGFRSDIIASSLDKVYKITTVRNTLLYNWKIVYGPILGVILGRINLYFIKKFQSVVACSNSVHRYLLTLNLESDVISNSVDPYYTSDILNVSKKQKLRSQLNLPENALIFTTVSSKLKGKNIEFLLNAFSDVELKSYILLIGGFLDSSIQQKFSAYKNIHFIGKVNNFFEYLKVSNYFISASLHEGMPNAVLEAMSVGIPVILSDIPSHKEIFDIAKSNIGKIFKNNSLDDLKSKIKEILDLEYSLISINCMSTIYQNFNSSYMAKQYTEYYISKCRNSKFKK